MTVDSAMDDSSTTKDRMSRTKETMKDKMSTMTDGSDKVTGSQTHVAAAQQALQKEGLNPGPIDGYMGPRTTAAAREFQPQETYVRGSQR